ncbi:MAG: hypothetical protein ACJKSS_02580 [Patescibacteria group bacterium UBA2103]
MASLLFIGMTLSLLGKVVVIVAGLLMHSKMIQEKQIDSVVVKEYGREKYVIFLGLALIIIGYILEVWALELLIF